MSGLTNYDLTKVIRDLLRIAEVAMPDKLYEQDPRVLAAYAAIDQLSASQHRPPSMFLDAGIPYVGSADPSDPVAELSPPRLASCPTDIEVSIGIDAFLAGPDSPATRPAAVAHILRDWLVGHGYIAHRSAGDSAN